MRRKPPEESQNSNMCIARFGAVDWRRAVHESITYDVEFDQSSQDHFGCDVFFLFFFFFFFSFLFFFFFLILLLLLLLSRLHFLMGRC